MLAPLPHQTKGSQFLAPRKAALLADEQRVGKTGAAVIGADLIFARRIIIVTTASARAQWAANVRDWSAYPRNIQAVYGAADKIRANAEVVVVAWSIVAKKQILAQIIAREWDLAIIDEAHYASNPEAARTTAVYGYLIAHCAVTWALTGTPIASTPQNLFPMLFALAPERLKASELGPDVMTFERFKDRYCVVKRKYYGGVWQDIVICGKNNAELSARLDGFWLRRTQDEVGIIKPVYELLHLEMNAEAWRAVSKIEGAGAILDAAEREDTKSLDINLGELRAITGRIKAHAIVAALKEEFECGLGKVVLMCWHKETIKILAEGLAKYGPCILDGSTLAKNRQAEVDAFNTDPNRRPFIGQMISAGEAIDLSPACNELIFVEASWTPKDMSQAALRITNLMQRKQPRVRFAVLSGSIDEALTGVLARKVATIREVMEQKQ